MTITHVGPETKRLIFVNPNEYEPTRPPAAQQELPPPDLGAIATAEALDSISDSDN